MGDITTEQGPRAYVLSDGVFTQLDVPDSLSAEAFGINNLGQIAGAFTDIAGVTHGFIAAPVPLPASAFYLARPLFLFGANDYKRNGHRPPATGHRNLRYFTNQRPEN